MTTHEPSKEAPKKELTQAAEDVIAERKRQIEVERWTAEHDEQHDDGSLCLAAACYARNASTWLGSTMNPAHADYAGISEPGYAWPWPLKWWKPKNPRRDLVRAGALILAEIERIDRSNPAAVFTE